MSSLRSIFSRESSITSIGSLFSPVPLDTENSQVSARGIETENRILGMNKQYSGSRSDVSLLSNIT